MATTWLAPKAYREGFAAGERKDRFLSDNPYPQVDEPQGGWKRLSWSQGYHDARAGRMPFEFPNA